MQLICDVGLELIIIIAALHNDLITVFFIGLPF